MPEQRLTIDVPAGSSLNLTIRAVAADATAVVAKRVVKKRRKRRVVRQVTQRHI